MTNSRYSFIFPLLVLLRLAVAEQQTDKYGCDYYSVDESTPFLSLTANTFHKICPKQLNGAFGQPICGDGTAFSFFFTSPPQRKANRDKILIEFMGGGACWDDQTCGQMGEMLSFPEQFNEFVGLSCSEIHYGTQHQDGYPISMLCGQTIGNVDFTAYNTIVVPYCTQDIHIGSNTVTYDDGSTVNHMGAHNMMSVLRWVFRNFKNPKHIALTGCSAGGTALPVAYDLINKHYNRAAGRTVQISVITDSPVYLTPEYFLYNALDNWNPWKIIKRMGFNYQKWQYSEEYPTRVWDHVLRRGSNDDRWGFVSHTNDDTSQTYYKWMSGNGDDGNRQLANAVFFERDVVQSRRLDDGGDDNDWWTELSASIDTIQQKHKNVDAFWIDGDGHCSFGLYYPLQEDGFAEWAGEIFKEQRIVHPSAAVPLFLFSLLAGGLLFLTAFARGRKGGKINVDDDNLLENERKGRPLYWLTLCTAPFQTFPLTAGYALAVTIYFWTMLVVTRFAHPINNPSLGPSAIGLSKFGINNPSLIVYRLHIQRLLTSNFLCSGVLTYLLLMLYLFRVAKPLEMIINNNLHLGLAWLMTMLGANLVYAFVGNGASCSTMAAALGLTAFYISVRRAQGHSVWCVTFTMVFVFALVSLLFPFNSWIILAAAVGFGVMIARVVFTVNPEPSGSSPSTEPGLKLRRTNLFVLGGAYAVLMLVIMSRVHAPNQLYLEPYYTGCDLMLSEGEDLESVASNFYNAERRGLNEKEGDYGNMCAQFCVPHIASRGVSIAADHFLSLPIKRGTCEEIGYDEHMADKTFKELSYTLDIELFVQADQDDNN